MKPKKVVTSTVPKRSTAITDPTKPNGRKTLPHRFKPGNPGRPKGLTTKFQRVKRRIMENTGMMPMDFLMHVMRDSVFDTYDIKVMDRAQRAAVRHYTPAEGAKHIPVTLEQRLRAAATLLPYTDRKMPIAIDGGEGKPITTLSADMLASMPSDKLAAFMAALDGLGIGLAAEGVGAVKAVQPERLDDGAYEDDAT